MRLVEFLDTTGGSRAEGEAGAERGIDGQMFPRHTKRTEMPFSDGDDSDTDMVSLQWKV